MDEANTRAVHLLAELFNFYISRPRTIGEFSRKRIRREGLHRDVCDNIAGMTDRYAMREAARLLGAGGGEPVGKAQSSTRGGGRSR